MPMYCGIDLHSNNSYVAIQEEGQKDVACRRVRNDLRVILKFLEPYRGELKAIAVESTYNWYWLVDGLMDAGYDVRLVNTTKASKYSDMKYTDDRHDARWLAHLLSLGILPEGYIMPREERGLRDLLRRRSFLVQKRTSLLLAIKSVVARNTGVRPSVGEIRKWTTDAVRFAFDDHLVAESICALLPIVRLMDQQIREIEETALKQARLRRDFKQLLTAPGIGDVLALTIMCETGDISRFAKVGNYGSYCRCVKSEHTTNRKKKGVGNRKNGNKYLSWAYSEAAHHAIRVEPLAKRYYDKKRSRGHQMVASRALANKMARACYYVMRDRVPFDPARTFRS